MKENILSEIREIKLIQGGMGVGVSNWLLARTNSSLGQLGVVSGVALERVITRRLQEGNEIVKETLLEFPDKELADFVIRNYFIEGGRKNKNLTYKSVSFPFLQVDKEKNITLKPTLEKLLAISVFTEVTLAKKGHNNPVGINLLYKLEWPMMPSLYGALLAGVDAVLIGAGLPTELPHVLDSLSKNEVTTMKAKVGGGKSYQFLFNPLNILPNPPKLKRPPFLAIINGHLAARGVKYADAYIVEGPKGGGHNGPARNKKLTELGEPDFGKKDELDLEAFKDFLSFNAKERREEIQPYWFAGDYAHRLEEALSDGAQGIQVGTPFAFSRESGIPLPEKEKLVQQIMNGEIYVYTDPLASPSGYPFKVMQIDKTLSKKEIYESRKRICNIGHLIDLFEIDGKIITRCPSEPLEHYERKGGKIEDTLGKKCLCNGLMSTIGYGNPNEPPIYTSGKSHEVVKELAIRKGGIYSTKDVVDFILNN